MVYNLWGRQEYIKGQSAQNFSTFLILKNYSPSFNHCLGNIIVNASLGMWCNTLSSQVISYYVLRIIDIENVKYLLVLAMNISLTNKKRDVWKKSPVKRHRWLFQWQSLLHISLRKGLNKIDTFENPSYFFSRRVKTNIHYFHINNESFYCTA